MFFFLPRPRTSQAPLCPTTGHLIVSILAFNRQVMDGDLMHGRCSVMYENTGFHFSFPVKGSLLNTFARFNQIVRVLWWERHSARLVPRAPSPGATPYCLPGHREQQTWQLCFVELAHLSLLLAGPVCYSWSPASHSLKKSPCHFKILVPCLGHISMFLAAVAMLPAVQICPIRHSPTGWNSV